MPIEHENVSCEYGARGPWWQGGRHRGIDLAAPKGTLVRAPWSGTVVAVGSWGRAYGARSPVIDFDPLPDGSPGLWGVLAHLSVCYVSPGERVGVGARVGRVGARGNATGPHLHFEVHAAPRWSPWWLRRDRNPAPWIRAQKPEQDVPEGPACASLPECWRLLTKRPTE